MPKSPSCGEGLAIAVFIPRKGICALRPHHPIPTHCWHPKTHIAGPHPPVDTCDTWSPRPSAFSAATLSPPPTTVTAPRAVADATARTIASVPLPNSFTCSVYVCVACRWTSTWYANDGAKILAIEWSRAVESSSRRGVLVGPEKGQLGQAKGSCMLHCC